MLLCTPAITGYFSAHVVQSAEVRCVGKRQVPLPSEIISLSGWDTCASGAMHGIKHHTSSYAWTSANLS
jgi:hypothetical protein